MTMPSRGSISGYRIGDVMLDIERRQVTREGGTLRLGKLSYEMLVALSEAAPGIVSQEELAERLWDGRYVNPETIKQRVKLLREALVDSADHPRYIQVVRGQGYRLIPEVRQLTGESSSPAWKRPVFMAATFAVVGLVAAAGTFWSLAARLDTSAAGSSTTEVDTSVDVARPVLPDSIAVLPFENLSPDPDDAYFATGIHAEVLNQLMKLSDLNVIARGSVQRFADGRTAIADIARQLNVETILEGSVRYSENRVRIAVQLIDPESSTQLWSEVYERDLANIFAVQTDIAIAIAETLQATPSPEELAQLNEARTQNTRAWNFYVSGNDYMGRLPNQPNTVLAIVQYERALEEDPTFATVWAALATAHMIRYMVETTDARLVMAEEAIARAFELAPNLPEAHLALGRYHHGLGKYEAALQEYGIAEQGMFGRSEFFASRAFLFAAMGDLERSVVEMARAIQLDPRNTQILNFQGSSYEQLGDYTQAKKYYERVLEITPDCISCFVSKAVLIPLYRDGDATSARMSLENPPTEIGSLMERNWWWGWLAALYTGDYDSALGYLDHWAADTIETPKASLYGATYRLADRPDLAERQFQVARKLLESALATNPEDFRIHIALGEVMAGLGDSKAALSKARQASELLPTSANPWSLPLLRYSLITRVLAPAGQNDAAIEQLDALLSAPGSWSIEGLLPDPRLDPIRDDPRFQALVEKYRR